MNKTVKKIVVIGLLAFIAFNLFRFFSTKKDDSDTKKSNLVKTTTSSNVTVNADKFLNLLLGINTINLSVDIFKNDSFRSLIDFSLKDEEQKLDLSYGRKNPFLPIGQDDGAASFPSENDPVVTTVQATQITSIDAVLQASLENVESDNDQYFEWGISQTLPLGNTTASVPFSGNTFSYKLANLVPNTTYYYRAVIKKDFKIITGQILSFKTPLK